MDCLERAARALFWSRGGDIWNEASEIEKEGWIKSARSMLEDMREPDEGMLEVAYLADENELTAYDSWQAMIDQALKG